MVVLQYLASMGVEASVADLKQAFAQTYPTNRKTKLVTLLPAGIHHPDVGPGQCLMVEKEIYGLVSGPSWLRQSLMSFFLNKGYVRNHYEKCALSLPPSWAAKTKGTIPYNEGVVLIEVDDILEGGNDRHRA